MPITPNKLRLLAVAAACIAAWVIVAGLSAHAPLTASALGHQRGRIATQLIIPQGWNFFTRDPREDDIYVYVYDGSGWEEALAWPNSSAANAYGFSRTGRAQGIEVGHIVAAVDWNTIEKCRGSLASCASRGGPSRTARNPVPAPSLCGPLVVVMKEPVPWAWAHSQSPNRAPMKAAKVNVQCW